MLPRALLLSAALHGIVLSIPYWSKANPFGEPLLGIPRVQLPLQATLRPAAESPQEQRLYAPGASDAATPPAEPAPENPATSQAPPGQQHGDEISAPTYFPFKALTREPEPLGEFQPRLPPLPGGASGRGQLTIRIWINPAGSIDRVQMLDGNLTEAYRQAVVEAFARMTFRAGEINGLPVGSWTDVVIDIPAESP